MFTNLRHCPCVCHKESISSTFYARIFRIKLRSKSNSKQKKAAQKTLYQKRTRKPLMKLKVGWIAKCF